jgi:hypothetical protein
MTGKEPTVASIEAVQARQILDSRGNPTLEVEVVLDDGSPRRSPPHAVLCGVITLDLPCDATPV